MILGSKAREIVSGKKMKFLSREGVDDTTTAIYKSKTPVERLNIAFGLWRSAVIILTSSLRSLHPDWDETRVQNEVARRMSHGAL
jgi:hypothetical protein